MFAAVFFLLLFITESSSIFLSSSLAYFMIICIKFVQCVYVVIRSASLSFAENELSSIWNVHYFNSISCSVQAAKYFANSLIQNLKVFFEYFSFSYSIQRDRICVMQLIIIHFVIQNWRIECVFMHADMW